MVDARRTTNDEKTQQTNLFSYRVSNETSMSARRHIGVKKTWKNHFDANSQSLSSIRPFQSVAYAYTRTSANLLSSRNA